MYTLGAAARASGKSKATISRAIKAGRVSAVRDGNGGYAIDPAELHRVYPATGAGNGAAERYATPGATGFEQREIELLRDRLADKDARIADQAETIIDLRQRLDSLTAVLTDRRPWWRRWLR